MQDHDKVTHGEEAAKWACDALEALFKKAIAEGICTDCVLRSVLESSFGSVLEGNVTAMRGMMLGMELGAGLQGVVPTVVLDPNEDHKRGMN